MDRRSFVKGAVATGVAGAAAAASYGGSQRQAGDVETPRTLEYVGAKRMAGPAPRGIPVLPLDVDSSGRLVGRVIPVPGGVTNLEWYRYCGHEDAPGLDPDAPVGDDVLRFFATPDKLAQGFHPWYEPLLGAPMRVDHFQEPGFGALGAWRSRGLSGVDVLLFVVLFTGTDPENVAGTGKPLRFEGATPFHERLVREQVENLGFVALYSACTHFCCVAGWREGEIARARDAWDTVFCTCHAAAFDPTLYKVDSFQPVREPRPRVL